MLSHKLVLPESKNFTSGPAPILVVLRAGVTWSRIGWPSPLCFMPQSRALASFDGVNMRRACWFACRDCLSGIIWENRSAIYLVGAWILIVYFEKIRVFKAGSRRE